MCIKIISSEKVQEFDGSIPLENQIENAEEIIVSYDPTDLKIASFVGQMELMVKNGTTCKAEIKVNTNNCLNGMVLERYIEKLKKNLDINELAKKLSTFHYDADHKLGELSEICKGK